MWRKKSLTVRNLGKNKLGVYQGSCKGKVWQSETSYTSPCTDPAEEPSLSEGVYERSFFFYEEEEKAIKEQCNRKNRKGLEVEEDNGRRKQKGKSALGKIFLKK